MNQRRNQRRTTRFNYLLPPHDPGTGSFAPVAPKYPYYPAMMQVIEEDTHDNYVVCRGFDPESNRFLNSVPVAKPYGSRGATGTYSVGEVHPALKPRTAIGFTPGKGETSTGHPTSLTENIVALQTDDGVYVSWIFCGGGGGGGYRFAKLTTALESGGSATAKIWARNPSTGTLAETTEEVTVFGGWITELAVDARVCIAKGDDGQYYVMGGGSGEGVTNLRVFGTSLQMEKDGAWTTWHEGDECS